jgi:hypothetical protein
MKVWVLKFILLSIGIAILIIMTSIGIHTAITVIAALLLAFIFLKLKIGGKANPTDHNEHKPQLSGIAGLTQQLDNLGTKQTIMPIEMFQLANAFVEHENSQEMINALTNTKYANHQSLFVRRVVIIGLRRKAIFDNQQIVDMMYNKLSDPVGWVAYDAAWYFKEAKINNEKSLRNLRSLQLTK